MNALVLCFGMLPVDEGSGFRSKFFTSYEMTTKEKDHIDVKPNVEHIEGFEDGHVATKHQQEHGELYDEALERYGEEGKLDPAVEKKLLR